MSDQDRQQREAVMRVLCALVVPMLTFSPGPGKRRMEFKPGSVDALATRAQRYIETGVFTE